VKRRLCRSLLDECHCATEDGRGSGERVTPSEPRDILGTRSSKQMRGYPGVEELRTIESEGRSSCIALALNESGLLAESSSIVFTGYFIFGGGPSTRDFFSLSVWGRFVCVC
jgi:hypothetical protein